MRSFEREQTSIDQLWYTWSNRGLDSIRAGFRIRAASKGLNDIYSQRVIELDRYLRYRLPDGAYYIAPQDAPICLAFVDTESERILVNKVYIGKDGVGRPGNYFVHLLAGIPPTFSAQDAISLWRSPLWQFSDMAEPSMILPTLDLATLQDNIASVNGKNWKYRTVNIEKIRQYLPFVIQAFLSRRNEQHIYIAAPPGDVAALILGLTLCLPKQLLVPLTFSTYESPESLESLERRDIYHNRVLLIGTCWIPQQQGAIGPDKIFQSEYYARHLVMNCYTGEISPLQENKLAADFSKHAVDELLSEEAPGRLLALFDYVDQQYGDSIVRHEEFLEIYNKFERSPLKSDQLEILFKSRIETVSMSLKKMAPDLLHVARYERNWWEKKGKSELIHLREQNRWNKAFVDACSALAWQLMTHLNRALIEQNEQDSMTIVDVMVTVIPPPSNPDFWMKLLYTFTKEHSLREALYRNQNVYFALLNSWSKVVSAEDEYIVELLPISWELFKDFYRLRVPERWKCLATLSLLKNYNVREDLVRALDTLDPELLNKLFSYLLSDQRQWNLSLDIFSKLVSINYPKKIPIMYLFLNTLSNEHELAALLNISQLTSQDSQAVLENYGRMIAVRYATQPALLSLFEHAVADDVYYGKMRFLNVWLSSPSIDQAHSEQILHMARLSQRETQEFFDTLGQQYFSRYPNSNLLRELFDRLTASGDYPEKMDVLNSWLETVSTQAELEQRLEAAHLNLREIALFLEQYEPYYLQQYPQSMLLLKYIREYLMDRSLAQPGSEMLLDFLCEIASLPGEIQQLAQQWQIIGTFLKSPVADRRTLAGVSIALQGIQQIKPASEDELVLFLEVLVSAVSTLPEEERDWESIVSAAMSTSSKTLDATELFSLLSMLLGIVTKKITKINSDESEKQRIENILMIYIQFLLYSVQVYKLPSDEQRSLIYNFLDKVQPYLEMAPLDKISGDSYSASIYDDWISYKSRFGSQKRRLCTRIAVLFTAILRWLRGH